MSIRDAILAFICATIIGYSGMKAILDADAVAAMIAVLAFGGLCLAMGWFW